VREGTTVDRYPLRLTTPTNPLVFGDRAIAERLGRGQASSDGALSSLRRAPRQALLYLWSAAWFNFTANHYQTTIGGRTRESNCGMVVHGTLRR